MLFFWKKKDSAETQKNIKKKGKQVLRQRAIPQFSPQCPPTNKDIHTSKCIDSKQNSSDRRASLSPSFSPAKNSLYRAGSITVEASFAVPLFLFFCIQMISVLNLIHLHSSLEATLHQEVCSAAVRAYAFEKTEEDMGIRNFVQNLLIREKVIERAGKKYLDRSLIVGGSDGIRMAFTRPWEEQDVVDVILYYRVKPMVDILGFSGFSMANRCRMKAWTGYRIPNLANESQEGEEIVYITETGVVYHKDRTCTHLQLSVQTVEASAVRDLRNENGGKYYPCESCGLGAFERVYITDQGDRFHSSLGCSGLKRTIFAVSLSEVEGRRPCSRCSDT